MSYLSIPISEPLHICEAQRAARMLSKAIGLDDVSVLNAVTAVTELANHLFIRHEKAGKIEMAVITQNHRLGLELKVDDHPGRNTPPIRVFFARC